MKLFSGVASFRIWIRQAYLLHQFNGVKDNFCLESELEAQEHSEINSLQTEVSGITRQVHVQAVHHNTWMSFFSPNQHSTHPKLQHASAIVRKLRRPISSIAAPKNAMAQPMDETFGTRGSFEALQMDDERFLWRKWCGMICQSWANGHMHNQAVLVWIRESCPYRYLLDSS